MPEIVDIAFEKIGCIRNLWEKLNELHYEDTVYFEDHYESFSFEERIAVWRDWDPVDLKISIVKEGPRFLGYCVSTKAGIAGEIESIYLEPEIQGIGLGKRLVGEHVAWLKAGGCKRIRAAVSYGHEGEVEEFYHRLGFFERLIYFELKE